MRIKRGSKRVRKILSGKNDECISCNISKYAELTETIIHLENSKILNSSCWYNYFHNSTKTFIFKLHNNLLGMNSRVAHFVRGHQSTCTFCDLSREPEENSENTKHIFFYCRHVELLLTQIYTWIFDSDVPISLSRTEYFVGFKFPNEHKNRSLHVINLIVKKFIWDCKLRFTIPEFNSSRIYITGEVNRISRQAPFIRTSFIQSGIFHENQGFRF